MLTVCHRTQSRIAQDPQTYAGFEDVTQRDHLDCNIMEPDTNTTTFGTNVSAAVEDAKENAPPTLAEPASGPAAAPEMSGALPKEPAPDAAPTTETVTGMLVRLNSQRN